MAQEIIGGGSLPVCNVTPSDMAGQGDNLISRIESLEQSVSELSAANVSANQLSDLAQDAGWITGVTFMGTEGWTQTPFGTLIPPAGWTGFSSIIDGETGLSIYSNGSVPGGAAVGIDGIKTVWTTDYPTDIATSSAKYIHPYGVSAAHVNLGDAALTQGTVDGGSRNGWIPDTQGTSYQITAELQLAEGSSPPTTGYVYLSMRRTAVVSGTNVVFQSSSLAWPAGGLSGLGEDGLVLNATGYTDIGNTVAEGFTFYVVNNTDGDISVYSLKTIFTKVS